MTTSAKAASSAAKTAAKKPAQTRKAVPAKSGSKKTIAETQKKTARPVLKTRLHPTAPWPFPTGKRP